MKNENVEKPLTSCVLEHKVTCYNRRGHHVNGSEFDRVKLTEYKGVQLKNVFTINRKGLAVMTSSISAAIKYDVVHVHAEDSAFMCWLPKVFGKRVIITVHGDAGIIGKKMKVDVYG